MTDSYKEEDLYSEHQAKPDDPKQKIIYLEHELEVQKEVSGKLMRERY